MVVNDTWPVAAALGALVLAGCANITTFDRDRVVVDPDAHVVALAFDTSRLADGRTEAGGWVFDRAFLNPVGRKTIAVSGEEEGLTLILLESSGDTFKFGDLRLVRVADDERTEFYESRNHGPAVPLERGRVTYAGTLVVEAISYDAKSGHPAALQLRMVDGWDDQARAWRRTFAVLDAAEPVRRIAADWSENGVVSLNRSVASSSRYPFSRRVGAGASGNYVKPRIREPKRRD